jgi:hypothetical protein
LFFVYVTNCAVFPADPKAAIFTTH